MFITLTRTGGFTGIPLKKTIDTSKLPQDERKKIEELLLEVQKGINGPKGNLPDQFSYTISVDDGQKVSSVTIPESEMPEQLRRLLTR